MTPEEINIKIGTAMGFQEVSPHPSGYFEGRLRHKVDGEWQRFDKNYYGDLNHMAEAEEATFTTLELRLKYELELFSTTNDSPFLWGATAAQRAEAFIKTLESERKRDRDALDDVEEAKLSHLP